jgi:hypothetical protein
MKLTTHPNLVPRSRKCRFIHPLPIYLYGIVLNYLSRETTIPFFFSFYLVLNSRVISGKVCELPVSCLTYQEMFRRITKIFSQEIRPWGQNLDPNALEYKTGIQPIQFLCFMSRMQPTQSIPMFWFKEEGCFNGYSEIKSLCNIRILLY